MRRVAAAGRAARSALSPVAGPEAALGRHSGAIPPTICHRTGRRRGCGTAPRFPKAGCRRWAQRADDRSEEHTTEIQSLMRLSYAVFCLKKTNKKTTKNTPRETIIHVRNIKD